MDMPKAVHIPAIAPGLYLGNIGALSDRSRYDRIVSVVSADGRHSTALSADEFWSVYYLEDEEGVPHAETAAALKAAARDIHAAIALGRAVLIHCLMGINRSCAAVVWYAIKYRGMSSGDAIDLIRHAKGMPTRFDVDYHEFDCGAENKCSWPTLTNRTILEVLGDFDKYDARAN